MQKTALIMGMPITIKVVDDGSSLDSIFEKVFGFFRHVDEIFSPFKKTSMISRLSDRSIDLAACPPEVRQVIAECEAAKRRTNGYFDINFNGRLDPSGYVKGWAIERAANLIIEFGLTNFYIEAGGDSQVCGRNENDEPWKVGIKHPRQKNMFAKILRLNNAAIATSGTYERGEHIYNPLSGQLADELLSLSVVGTGICEADMLATAAFAMGPVLGLEFIAAEGLEGFAISNNFEVLTTVGFSYYEE